MQVRHEKDIMTKNREFREQQYRQRRQKDFEEALYRERLLCQQAKTEYERQTQLQLSQHRELVEFKNKERMAKRTEMCKEIVDQLVDMAMKVGEYRMLGDGVVPKKLLNEWKTLFLNGRSLNGKYIVSAKDDKVSLSKDDGTNASGNAVDEDLAGIQLLDEQDFNEYLKGTGEWPYPNDSTDSPVPKNNELLGLIVNNILEIAHPPEIVYKGPVLPSVPICMSIVGKRFSGKHSLAQNIAKLYKLNIISMDTLIKESVTMAGGEATTSTVSTADGTSTKPKSQQSTTSKASTPSTTAAAMKKVQLSLYEGNTADDATLVSLVVDAIRRVSIAGPEKDNTDKSGGWILVDFPRTKAQAQLLERELSGYEDPKAPKFGGLKRQNGAAPAGKNAGNKDAEKDKKKFSLISPPPDSKITENQGSAAIRSGLDLVVMLDVDNETAVKRATGRRFDPITNTTYHLEFNPPPVDQPGIMERLVNLDDEALPQEQLQYQLSAFEDQAPQIQEWFTRFQNLHVIQSTESTDKVMETTTPLLTHVIEKKEKEKPVVINEASANGVAGEGVNATGESNDAQTEDKEAADHVAPGTADSTANANNQQPGVKSGTAEDKNARLMSTKSKDFMKSSKPGTANTTTTDLRKSLGKTPLGNSASQLNEVAQELPPNPLTRKIGPDGKKIPTRELAEILADEWATIENTYTDMSKFVFRAIRREREASIRHFHTTKSNFKKFLERPDKKQALVELFQKEYNDVEDDFRSDVDAKAEFHQRVEELREKLWDICDQKRDEAENELHAVLEDKWAEERFVILTNVFISMMQVESDRYVTTRQLVHDYFRDAHSLVIDDLPAPNVKLPLATNVPFDLTTLLNVGESSHRRAPSISTLAEKRPPVETRDNRKASAAPNAKAAKTVPNSASSTATTATGIGSAGSAGASNNGANSVDKKDLKEVDTDALFKDLFAAIDGLNPIFALNEDVHTEKEKKEKEKEKDKKKDTSQGELIDIYF